MKYRKKPVVIEAIQWNGLNLEEVKKFVDNSLYYQIIDTAWEVGKGVPHVHMSIKTLEGEMLVNKGDYIIKGVNGEFYPCKKDIFDKTYDVIDCKIQLNMERLTEKFDNRQHVVLGCGNNCKYDYRYCSSAYDDCPVITKIYNKLGKLEDLGEEVGMPLDKLLNLIGETVYEIKDGYIYSFYIQYISYDIGYESYMLGSNSKSWLCVDNYNTTWFMTQQDAERKLEEMKNE